MKISRYFLDLSYDGSNFHGWQKQPNALGIQEVIEKSLSTITQKKQEVVAAGRTDTGVHARQMIAHVDLDQGTDIINMRYKLNKLLPKSIALNGIEKVKPDAHARFDAISREYEYIISKVKDPFVDPYSIFIHKELSVSKMQEAANFIKKHRDFKCFSKSRTDVNTYFCQIEKAQWTEKDNLLVFTIKADRFLRNMVRAVVGTLVDIGLGKTNLTDLEATLESRDRSRAGKSMAAKALFLKEIQYPKAIRNI